MRGKGGLQVWHRATVRYSLQGGNTGWEPGRWFPGAPSQGRGRPGLGLRCLVWGDWHPQLERRPLPRAPATHMGVSWKCLEGFRLPEPRGLLPAPKRHGSVPEVLCWEPEPHGALKGVEGGGRKKKKETSRSCPPTPMSPAPGVRPQWDGRMRPRWERRIWFEEFGFG